MAVFIYQPDALALMATMEGEEWLAKQKQAQNAGSPYCFPLWLEAWQLKSEMGAEYEDEPLASFVFDRFSGAVEPVIYGKGGYHRYIVRANGEVQFSSFHAIAERRPQAQALGFTLC